MAGFEVTTEVLFRLQEGAIQPRNLACVRLGGKRLPLLRCPALCPSPLSRLFRKSLSCPHKTTGAARSRPCGAFGSRRSRIRDSRPAGPSSPSPPRTEPLALQRSGPVRRGERRAEPNYSHLTWKATMAKQIVSGPERRSAAASAPPTEDRTQGLGSPNCWSTRSTPNWPHYERRQRRVPRCPAVLRQSLCRLLPKRRINPLAQFGGGSLQV